MKTDRSEIIKQLITIAEFMAILVISVFFVLAGIRFFSGDNKSKKVEEIVEVLGSYEEEEVVTDLFVEGYTNVYEENGAYLYFNTAGNSIQHYNGTGFDPVYLKGVNIGTGIPGHFPGELAIEQDTYYRWFGQIAAMNANCIRVFSVQKPEFYNALYEYNSSAEKPLYLIQGLWFNEDILAESANVFDPGFMEVCQKECRELVDIMHGTCKIPEGIGAWGDYKMDISRWVLGWALGNELEQDYIECSNQLNPDMNAYQGRFFTCEGCTPYECFQAELADYIIGYEMDRFAMQRPLSFVNRYNPSGAGPNIEVIRPTGSFIGGLFASYNVYPHVQPVEQQNDSEDEAPDDGGTITDYRAYLEEIISGHTVPVIVAEYGVSVGRAASQAELITGSYTPYAHNDIEQGEMLRMMTQGIHDAGYAGAFVSSWQDEWYKKDYLTSKTVNAERKPLWNDVMSEAAHYGLLEFKPVDDKYNDMEIDGDKEDWKDQSVFINNEDVKLSMAHDSAYLYFLVEKAGADWSRDRVTIPLDITPHSGSSSYWGLSFDHPVDFILEINGILGSKLLVQEYYEKYPYVYYAYLEKELNAYVEAEYQASPDGAGFRTINYLVEKAQKKVDGTEIVPEQLFEAGNLVSGTTDPASSAYNSQTDYCYEGDILEIRIPWSLLNFRDPSSKEIEDDFRKNGGLSGMNVGEIYAGISIKNEDAVELVPYLWPNWNVLSYVEHLRRSYDIMRETLAGF